MIRDPHLLPKDEDTEETKKWKFAQYHDMHMDAVEEFSDYELPGKYVEEIFFTDSKDKPRA